MSKSNTEIYSLPSGPASLCFNKEEFMKNEFHADKFVVECRKKVSLEDLRDDLNVYLKILQAAMIELINQDYADFVNLSTNLVGLDKAINNISNPLSQFKQEVLNVKGAMDDAISSVEDKLKQQREIRNKKTCIQRLVNIIQSVEKIEKLLGILPGESQVHYHSELSGQLIERVATEFNRLQFYVNKSRGFPLVEEIKPRIANITTTLQYSLEGSFKEGLEQGEIHILRQCLRTYATIDKMRDAENLFRLHIVKPYMEEYVNEQYMHNNSDELKSVYNKVIEFVPRHCRQLKEVTSGAPQGGGEVVRGYDFLVNAVWPEVVQNIEARIPSIFAPGNPDIFHQKYLISMEFLDQFERQCGSQASVKRLRTHNSFATFMNKWSMPVYFQIRFQEIAGAYETALVTPFNNVKDHSQFRLHASQTLWECLLRCWTREVYLQPLCHRFWKLTLQLLSRHATWIKQVKQEELSKKEIEVEAVKTRSVTPTSALSSDINPATVPAAEETKNPPVTLRQLVCLVADSQILISKIPKYFEETIQCHFEKMGVANMDIFKESLRESQNIISEILPEFGSYIVQEISNQCIVHLKMVSDIPRLYRRTNREVPNKASSYITNLIKPLQLFLEDHSGILQQDQSMKWVTDVLSSISAQYLTVTSDVLTSVRKMEESLKRLKRSKQVTQSQGMSDDDKIREQISIDVQHFGEEISSLGVDKTDISGFIQLHELVETAKNQMNNDKS